MVFKRQKFTGGQNIELKIPADKEVPYFVKGGCVLPSDEGEYGFKKVKSLYLRYILTKAENLKIHFLRMTV